MRQEENLSRAIGLDRDDPLRAFRDAFVIPKGMIYLDGNSLGLLPRVAASRAREVVEQEWGRSAISGWNDHHWIDLPLRVGGQIAKLIGAGEDEVIAGETTSVNLFKCRAAALSLRPGRRVIVMSRDDFPTDLYIAEGIANFLGVELRHAEPSRVAEALDDNVAAVSLSLIHI